MKRKARIYYIALDDFWRKEEKLAWLRDNPIEKIEFERLESDDKHNWLNQTKNDFESLLALIDKEVKLGKKQDASVFDLYTNSIKTNRDDWLYDFSQKNLELKIKHFIKKFNQQDSKKDLDTTIKWSDDLKSKHKTGKSLTWKFDLLNSSLYKPFVKQIFYGEKTLSDRMTENHYRMFGKKLNNENKVIMFVAGSRLDFSCLATNIIPNYAIFSLDPAQCIPFYVYDSNDDNPNQKHENITDWAVHQFQTNYKQANGANITKQDIFYYTYGVLHSPQYRKKYEQNLKREFPRLPFYDDFVQWRDWGEQLMDLHINYETQDAFALERKDLDLTAKQKIKQESLFGGKPDAENESFIAKPKTKLRADKINGTIEIDSHTTLTGVPAIAWEYKLGNRSALEWILDQYKEKKPQDATIAERFNTYKFEDYKESVVDLLKRVCNVSVKTMEIINQMPDAAA